MDRSEDIMKLLLLQLATTGFCNLRVTLEGGAQGGVTRDLYIDFST